MASHILFGARPQFLRVFLLLISLLTLDSVTKAYITEQPLLNPGFVFGWLELSSSFYRVFCISMVLGISVMLISLAQYLVWKTVPILVWELVFLEAGLIGNGIDKLRFGAVRDFIPLLSTSIYFNLADCFLWIGTLSILVTIWGKADKIWRKNELRSSLIIFPKSQLKVIGILLLIVTLAEGGLFISLTALLRSSDVTFSLSEATVIASLFLLMSCLVATVFGVLWSHRMFGPFRAIERFILGGKESKMRESDDNECVREILVLLKNKQN